MYTQLATLQLPTKVKEMKIDKQEQKITQSITRLYRSGIETNPLDPEEKGVIINLLPSSPNGLYSLFLDRKTGALYIKDTLASTTHWYGPDYNQEKYYDGNLERLGDDKEYILFLTRGGDLIVLPSPVGETAYTNKTIIITGEKFRSSWPSFFRTHAPFQGNTDIDALDNSNYIYSLELGDDAILIINRTSVQTQTKRPIWSTTYMWESFETPYSVRITKDDNFEYRITNDEYLGSNNATNSIIYQYQERYLIPNNKPLDHSPFKILPLWFFLKYKNVMYDKRTLGGLKYYSYSSGNTRVLYGEVGGIGVKWYSYNGWRAFYDGCPFSFLGTEKYLPLGDPYMANVSTPWADDWGATKGFMVAVVKNDPIYSKPLKKTNYKALHDAYECNYQHDYQYTNWAPNSVDTGDGYNAIGGTISRNEWNEGFYRRTYAYYSGVNETDIAGDFVAAAVNSNYTYKYEKGIAALGWYFGDDDRSGCYHDHNMYATSPFRTYVIQSGATDWWFLDKFFDLIPQGAITLACAKLFDPVIQDNTEKRFIDVVEPRCDAVTKLTGCTLESGNFTSSECIEYYRNQNNDPQNSTNYDGVFTKFCSLNDNWKKPEYQKLCACFIPDSAYQQYIEDVIKYVPDPQKAQARSNLTDAIPCVYAECSIGGAAVMPRFNFNKSKDCKANAFQLCLSSTNITNAGNIGDVNVEQVNECIQNTFSGGAEPTTPAPKKTSTNWVSIIIALFVLIILSIILIKKI